MAEVVLSGLSKSFGATRAVDGVSLSIGDGEFIVLLGPTGAGKTTLLRLVAGLEEPDQGTITIHGFDATKAAPAERDVAFVFQQYSLYPHLTVYENLAFPLRSPIRGLTEAEIDSKVREIAKLVRIDDKLQNQSTRLSGGQMQRVAIARALVRSPSIYLMDEPLSSLDAKLRGDLRVELKRIQRDLGATILYVTHDQIEAMTLATRIGVMDRGRLVQMGTPRDIYTDPVNMYVASRLGMPAINFVPLNRFPSVAAPRGASVMGLRTEHLSIEKSNGADGNGLVTWVEHLGDQNHLHIDMGGQDVVVLSPPDSGLEKGDKVHLTPLAPLFFDANGQRVRG